MQNRKDIDVKYYGDDGEVTKTTKIYVIAPVGNVINRADRQRAKIWTECVDDGIKTKDELAILLEKRGLWTKDDKTKEEKFKKDIDEMERKLYLGDGQKKIPLSDGIKDAITMRKLRREYREHMMTKNEHEQNTADNIADNARFDFLVANCTFYENGQSVYNDIVDYNNRHADELAFNAAQGLAELLHGYDPKSEANLPENKWLKHFDLLNDDLSLVNEDGHLVDVDGRLINDKGQYVNDAGDPIDKEGNLLDDEGNYVIQVDYEKNKPARRRSTKKESVGTGKS